MNEVLILGMSGLAGLIMGAMFFGGLWWTVRKGISSNRQGLWFLGSLLLRSGVVVVGFHVVAGEHWQRLLACLFGFAVARFLMIWLTPPPISDPNARAAEIRHAP